MNRLIEQKEQSHKMLIRHHECTQELEFKQLSVVHKLRREQQQNQHKTEWDNQMEYNKQAELELRKKHLSELKQQPKTLKVIIFDLIKIKWMFNATLKDRKPSELRECLFLDSIRNCIRRGRFWLYGHVERCSVESVVKKCRDTVVKRVQLERLGTKP